MAFDYQKDIVNSSKWNLEDWKWFFQERYNDMRAKRAPFDDQWINYETQTNAVSFYDNQWELQVNIPLEKTLKEIYMGRTDGKVNIDIIPDGQTDIEQLQPSKYAMMFFMDGNWKDTFWKEDRYLRETKSTYWSGIDYTGIRSYKDCRFQLKEWEEIQSNTDLLDKNKFEEIENETWFFFPKSIHPKDFFIDDKAYGQPDVQYADDCIMKEMVTATEFEKRYKNNKAFEKDQMDLVTYNIDELEKNKNDNSIQQRQIVLYHYFHRITKKYLIVANREQVIYNWLYLYDDGKLPFVNTQHYTNINRFWGEGIPERVAYLKAYKSEIFQDILSGAAMSSGIHLLAGNDDQIGQDWNFGGRWVNILRNTAWAEWVKQLNTSPNLWYFTTVLQLLDQQVTMDSGINPLEQFDPGTDKVGIKEIMEASKAVRNKSVDENYNIWLDEKLTMMLARIKQFAPALLKEDIEEWWEIIKTIFPKIKIDWYTVEKKWKQQVFTENLGKFGYFELKPEIVQWVWVKVVTPSTNSTLPILERQKVNEFITNLLNLAQVAELDWTGEAMKELTKFMRYDELLWWIWDAYNYDINGLKANTEKDEIAKENIKLMDQLKEVLTINPEENAEENIQNNVSSWQEVLWQLSWGEQQNWDWVQWIENNLWWTVN